MTDIFLAYQGSAPANTNKTWNDVRTTSSALALSDSSGAATGLSITAASVTGAIEIAVDVNSVPTGSAAWVDELPIARWGHYKNSGTEWASYTIAGFAPGEAITYESFCSAGFGRLTEVRINGGVSQTQDANVNTTETLVFTGTADASGLLVIEHRQGAGSSGSAYQNAGWISYGGTPTLSITSADDITTEGQTAAFTLANNTAAPVSATLNGTSVGTLALVSGSTYSYVAPLIADDATADLVVSVDSTTVSTVVSYANSYPYTLVTHGTPNANSIFFDTQFATTGPVEWGVVTDYNAAIVTVDHAAMDTAEDELNDVDLHSTEVAEGTSTATYKYFVPESGATGTWQASITVEPQVTQVPQGTITVGTITKDDTSASIPFTYSASDQTGFEHSTNGTTWVSATSPISRSGLTEQTAYSGQIRAVNGIGNGTAATYNFTTEATPVVPAAAPVLGTPAVTDTTATISVSYTQGDETGFEYRIAAGAWQAFTPPLSLTGLTSETPYTGDVRAVNAVGGGPVAAFSFTTEAVYVPPPASTPSVGRRRGCLRQAVYGIVSSIIRGAVS